MCVCAKIITPNARRSVLRNCFCKTELNLSFRRSRVTWARQTKISSSYFPCLFPVISRSEALSRGVAAHFLTVQLDLDSILFYSVGLQAQHRRLQAVISVLNLSILPYDASRFVGYFDI